ncbi:Meckel syndrome type 1 protein-like isoform X2 [Anopheles darlingi]|uniref:Meckel syndrome type 1 protein-like isoform X2 n=1 Tax=Anopheles darlingi TaxID=43151 RepID=UPI00210053D0|nr:Meckel syndrome type 1 protein-like isoform X2 [Anopheles darlingi]
MSNNQLSPLKTMNSDSKLFKTGIYRTGDDISNFQFRILIHKIHSLIDMPNMGGQIQAFVDDAVDRSMEIKTVKWQEKMFSRFEVDYYILKENCKTERQKKYYHRLKKGSLGTSILFTYVDGDDYYPEDLIACRQSHLISQLAECKVQSMYLMADLGKEVLLFTIHWFIDHGLLHVYPDFNHLNINPYYQEIRDPSLQMYHYALEKLFEPAFPIPTKKFPPLVYGRETRFNIPKMPRRYNAIILLELQSAVGFSCNTGFSYNNIHIRYKVQPSEGVQSVKNDCHELQFTVSNCNRTCPKIDVYFEAVSIDSSNRERYLGHSHTAISLMHRKGENTLNFVQLNNTDAADGIEAFLVGNRRKVDLASFYGKVSQSMLNRYGNKTCRSGKLFIRYHTIVQHQPRRLNEGLYKSAFKCKNVTLDQLIASYHAARERMEERVNIKANV